MASTTETARNQQAYREKGLISTLLGLPFAFLGILMVALFFSIVSEWIGLFFFWPQAGWRHSQDMLNSELAWISATYHDSLWLDDVGQSARRIIVLTYEWCFEQTGLIHWINRSAEQARLNNRQGVGLLHYLGRAYVHIEDYGLAAVYAVLTLLPSWRAS